MIPSIHDRGSETIGLIRYLYGPGTKEEHIDPHLVAAFDPLTPDPGRDPKATYEQLQRLLDQPVNALPAGKRPEKHVWHLSVRAAPEDPILSDEDWAAITRRMVAATGIAPDGDEAACRWAAVRHADDHIHIIATLVRDDGRRPRLHNEARRAQAECRRIEIDYGLRRVAPGDGTAAKPPTSAERHKAEREGRDRTAREELRETVRRAVAGATSEEEFLGRLKNAGLLVRTKVLPSGDLQGYKVALPDDRNGDKQPVYYAGSTLAPDLSLPRIRKRFSDSTPSQGPDTTPSAQAPSGPTTARRRTANAAWQAMLVIDHGEDAQVAAHIAAAGEVLDALAKTSAAHTRAELREAAFAFERATRSHIQAERGHDRALRQAARDLIHSGPALGRGEDGATTAMAIDMVFFLVTATAHWHAKKNHAQQAAAAHQAAAHLRAAYQAAAGMTLAVLYQRGRHLSQPLRQRQTAYLRQAVPELAEQALTEPGWFALAATLADAEAAGHDPAQLLAEATERQELATADSVTDVLVWRLRRMADLPADATTMPERTTTADPGNRRATRPLAGRDDQPRRAR
ncbi:MULTISPECIES: relaxase/mobilization nuclease domain-containing protein [Streptomyces]|uniref:relaxase/mobilization nuclease domain-containing protein n=1 Tax=Streptomyces TaxID=1883 RepID=UPI0004E61D11|nr:MULTISPECIES: relaxase/mobilization nuclease domain-containing protein [Streptomyces]KFG05949.1 mobilization protein [Streptomyces scabiei]MDX2837130.1 relaxase/mobilization nuclease domain-containing protein [Streptomyces scabiei]MDX3681769.1 relaxase/mobilization nuclease domain-containing protein [Streptomyces scabiei]